MRLGEACCADHGVIRSAAVDMHGSHSTNPCAPTLRQRRLPADDHGACPPTGAEWDRTVVDAEASLRGACTTWAGILQSVRRRHQATLFPSVWQNAVGAGQRQSFPTKPGRVPAGNVIVPLRGLVPRRPPADHHPLSALRTSGAERMLWPCWCERVQVACWIGGVLGWSR